jgi:hypothetical protein
MHMIGYARGFFFKEWLAVLGLGGARANKPNSKQRETGCFES